jgi:hypothetical protein
MKFKFLNRYKAKTEFENFLTVNEAYVNNLDENYKKIRKDLLTSLAEALFLKLDL